MASIQIPAKTLTQTNMSGPSELLIVNRAGIYSCARVVLRFFLFFFLSKKCKKQSFSVFMTGGYGEDTFLSCKTGSGCNCIHLPRLKVIAFGPHTSVTIMEMFSTATHGRYNARIRKSETRDNACTCCRIYTVRSVAHTAH